MDPVPYEIEEGDVDQVLEAYRPGEGGWPEDVRERARAHVMDRVLELAEEVRSASEDPSDALGASGDRTGAVSDRPGDRAPARREAALAAIEDLLIRDGFIDVDADENRVFPTT